MAPATYAPLVPEDATQRPEEMMQLIDKITDREKYRKRRFQPRTLSMDEVRDELSEKEDEIKGRWQTVLKEQQSCHSDMVRALAQLIHFAPDAAGKLLDWCLQDTGDRGLRINFAGPVPDVPMVSMYVSEKDAKHRGLVDNRGDAFWKQPSIHEVTRFECLLVNILNIDLLQALATTESLDLFARSSVQAIVNHAWFNQVYPVIRIKLVVYLIELCIFLQCGLTPKGALPFDRLFWTEPHNATDAAWLYDQGFDSSYEDGDHSILQVTKAFFSQRFVPVRWNILAAFSLLQFAEFIVTMIHLCRRCCTQSMRQVWMDWSWFQPSLYAVHFVFRTAFLVLTLIDFNGKNLMLYGQQLSVCFAYLTSTLGMFLVFTCFANKFTLSLVAMEKTLMDPAVWHFFLMLAMLFLIVIMAWMILDRESTFAVACHRGWKALILSDGDSLESFSDVPLSREEDDHEIKNTAGFLAVAGSYLALLFFSTFLTNLLIAIFSEAYSKTKTKVWLHFYQRRAQLARNCILAWPGQALMSRWPCQNWKILARVLISVAVLLQLIVHQYHRSGPVVLWSVSIPSIVLGALGLFLAKAIPFNHEELDWFASNTCDNNCDNQSVLFVWCRKDFNEHDWLGFEESETELSNQVKELSDKFDNQVKEFSGKFDKMQEDLQKVLQAVQRR